MLNRGVGIASLPQLYADHQILPSPEVSPKQTFLMEFQSIAAPGWLHLISLQEGKE
jgi:hypothetical protein